MKVSQGRQQGRGVRHRLPPPDRPGHVADRHPHRRRPGRELDAGDADRRVQEGRLLRRHAGAPPQRRRRRPTTRPLCWLPREVDNSAGGQVWVPHGHVRPARRAAAAPLATAGASRSCCCARSAATAIVQGGVAALGVKFLSGVVPRAVRPATATCTSAASTAGRPRRRPTAVSSASATPASRSTCP